MQKNRRTLLFDLDETLIHCVEEYVQGSGAKYDHLIEIKLTKDRSRSGQHRSASSLVSS